MRVENARNKIEELQEFVAAFENYEPRNMKEMAVKLYAELNSVNKVASLLNEKGYRKEGKLVAGKRAQVKLNSNDVTKLLNSEVEEGDELHPIVLKILSKNRRRKGIVV